MNSFNGYPRNRVVYVVDEDEIALVSGMYELPTRVDSFIEMILRHQKYFAWYLFIFLVIEVTFSGSSYGRDQRIEEV